MKLITTISLIIFSLVCFSQAEITLDKTVHDYGTIKRKSDGHCTFTLKNSGDKPLVITNVVTSCGCTTSDWPKEPLRPGAEKTMTVLYDTKRTGFFSKTIKVFNNTGKSPIELTIKGKVTK